MAMLSNLVKSTTVHFKTISVVALTTRLGQAQEVYVDDSMRN